MKNVRERSKEKSNACAYVRTTLWPPKQDEKEEAQEAEPFDLEFYCRLKPGRDFPRLLNSNDPKDNERNCDEMKAMFDEAATHFVTPEMESGVVRAFQVCEKERERERV